MSHEAYFEDEAPATKEEMLALYGAGLQMALDLELEPQRRHHGMYTRARKRMKRPISYYALFSTFAIYQHAPEAGAHLDALGLGPHFTELSMSYESTRVSRERDFEIDAHYLKHPVYGENGKPLSHIYLFPGLQGRYISHPQTEAHFSFNACQPSVESGKEMGAVETRWNAKVLIENDNMTSMVGMEPGTGSELTQIQCRRLISLAGILGQHPETLDEEDY